MRRICPRGYTMRNGICSESSPSKKPIHHNIQKGKQDWDNMIGEYHSSECCYPPNPGNCGGAQYLVNIHCNQWEGYWYGISQFSPTCGSCSIPDYEQMILSCGLSDPDSMSQVGNDCGDTKWCPCICTAADIPPGEPGACEGPPLKSTAPPKLDFRRGGKVRRRRRR